jgi:hypothetical protein
MFTSSMLSSDHAPNTLICTIADRSELDRTAIQSGGIRAGGQRNDRRGWVIIGRHGVPLRRVAG